MPICFKKLSSLHNLEGQDDPGKLTSSSSYPFGPSQVREDLDEGLLQRIRPLPKTERGQKTKRKKNAASVIISTPIP